MLKAPGIANGSGWQVGYVRKRADQYQISAIAVQASMYGSVGTSAKVDMLVNQFLRSQAANAIEFGLNPLVYNSEALGLAFAFSNGTGSKAFANNFGPTNASLPNTTAGDAAFS